MKKQRESEWELREWRESRESGNKYEGRESSERKLQSKMRKLRIEVD